MSYVDYDAGTPPPVPQRVYAAAVYDAYKVYRSGEDEIRAHADHDQD